MFGTSGGFGLKKFHLSLEMGVEHRDRLCEEMDNAPSLTVLKRLLESAPNNMV